MMAAACLAIIVLSVAGAVMWWKRRPSGKLGAPPAPEGVGPRSITIFALIILAFGLLFPLLGASVLVALVIDRLLFPLFKSRFGL
jgi:uncharacterized iron-regulated membrane protein